MQITQWIIDQFGDYIDWEHAVILREFDEIPILEFMAHRCIGLIPNCVRSGARSGGVEAFRRIAKDAGTRPISKRSVFPRTR